ncbi:DoxX family protein [Gracilimonas sediminicola]|uniref:DoxX family protein n=1 Tax=Gracilimonas sediminicola TaxID=2952158 RepID=A0A9X2L1M3_9BACT|nr:DoxX family protein [Gracilimonas sediminicola]MCP9290584.1 DoxX family protein [Gracilimonas sediminicola]
MKKLNEFLNKHSKFGEIFIRIMLGFHLIYGTQDNVFSWDRMLEFSSFLEGFGFPFPIVSAVVSVYAQFFCGIMYIVGFHVRVAALIMVLNFIVAIIMVHIGDSYPGMFPAIVMLAGSLYLLFNGSKVLSIK